MTAIYLQTGRKIKDIPTGEGAEGIPFSPRGQRALVTAAKSGEVVAIDPQAKRETMRKKLDLSVVAEAQSRLFGDRFAASLTPVGLLFAPSGRRAYVAATQSDRGDRDRHRKPGRGAVIEAGREPDGMAVRMRARAAVLERAGESAARLHSENGFSESYRQFILWNIASSAELKSPLAFRERAISACAAFPTGPLCGAESWFRFARRSRLSAFIRGIGTEVELAAARVWWLPLEEGSGRDPNLVASLLLDVANRFQEIDLPVAAAFALEDRAGILERLGRLKEARSDCRRAVALVIDAEDRVRPKVSDEAANPGILRHLYERLIRLDLARDRDDEALLLSDEMRDLLGPRLGPTLRRFDETDLQRMLETLPPRTAVIEYAVIAAGRSAGGPQIAVAWVLASGRIERIDLPAGSPLADQHRLRAVRIDRPSVEAWEKAVRPLYAEWIALFVPCFRRTSSGWY